MHVTEKKHEAKTEPEELKAWTASIGYAYRYRSIHKIDQRF